MEPSREGLQGSTWILVLAGILFLSGILAASLLSGETPSPCAPAPGPAPCECTAGPSLVPLFTDPAGKIAQLSASRFSSELFDEAARYDPLLATPGTQVHMGFWSGRGNHGSMLRLQDTINEGPAASAVPPNRAISDEGVTTYYRYPSYSRILDKHWYERATAVNGTVTVFGRSCRDPHPVSREQADEVWGQYSSRYTEMAEMVARTTGRPVKAWCFVEGARANRLFYTHEYPCLQRLEEEGLAQVFFAKDSQADWTQPGDWVNGTVNAPPPVLAPG